MEINSQQLLTALLVLIIIYLLYCECVSEGMSQTRERANQIYKWFSKQEEPKYVNYRNDIEGSYSLEYYDIKKLRTMGELTPENIERVIS